MKEKIIIGTGNLPNSEAKIWERIKTNFPDQLDLFFISSDIQAIRQKAIRTTACTVILENIQGKDAAGHYITASHIAMDIRLKNGSARVYEYAMHPSNNDVFEGAITKYPNDMLIAVIRREIEPSTVYF